MIKYNCCHNISMAMEENKRLWGTFSAFMSTNDKQNQFLGACE